VFICSCLFAVVAEFASVSLTLGGASFGFVGLLGGFWTAISDSLGFVGLKVKAGEHLLVSFLLGGIRVKKFPLVCGDGRRRFTMRFSLLDICKDA
jgi:hypothetical protein